MRDKTKSGVWVGRVSRALITVTAAAETREAVSKLHNMPSGRWVLVECMAELCAEAYRDGQFSQSLLTDKIPGVCVARLMDHDEGCTCAPCTTYRHGFAEAITEVVGVSNNETDENKERKK